MELKCRAAKYGLSPSLGAPPYVVIEILTEETRPSSITRPYLGCEKAKFLSPDQLSVIIYSVCLFICAYGHTDPK